MQTTLSDQSAETLASIQGTVEAYAPDVWAALVYTNHITALVAAFFFFLLVVAGVVLWMRRRIFTEEVVFVIGLSLSIVLPGYLLGMVISRIYIAIFNPEAYTIWSLVTAAIG